MRLIIFFMKKLPFLVKSISRPNGFTKACSTNTIVIHSLSAPFPTFSDMTWLVRVNIESPLLFNGNV